ncbi:MAG: hypothetical protein K0U10_03715 [Gammaproteobacteria bacterium]|nr:hypothetical protein [Gammaproteobacteria bacterium]
MVGSDGQDQANQDAFADKERMNREAATQAGPNALAPKPTPEKKGSNKEDKNKKQDQEEKKPEKKASDALGDDAKGITGMDNLKSSIDNAKAMHDIMFGEEEGKEEEEKKSSKGSESGAPSKEEGKSFLGSIKDSVKDAVIGGFASAAKGVAKTGALGPQAAMGAQAADVMDSATGGDVVGDVLKGKTPEMPGMPEMPGIGGGGMPEMPGGGGMPEMPGAGGMPEMPGAGGGAEAAMAGGGGESAAMIAGPEAALAGMAMGAVENKQDGMPGLDSVMVMSPMGDSPSPGVGGWPEMTGFDKKMKAAAPPVPVPGLGNDKDAQKGMNPMSMKPF